MKSADAIPESKYSYRPTKDIRSFGEILNHVADISYTLCSNAKGAANPVTADGEGFEDRDRGLPQRLIRLLRWRVLRFTDAHLNDPADFFGVKTNKMFILTQVGNHDALHYGNLVTYLRLNGPCHPGAGFDSRTMIRNPIPSGDPLADALFEQESLRIDRDNVVRGIDRSVHRDRQRAI